MPKTQEINRNRPGVPPTQNPGMNVAASLHSSLPNLVSLRGYPMASHSENIGNKRTHENNISYKYMNKSNLSKLTKDQLIELTLKKETLVPLPRNKLWRKQETPITAPRRMKPIPYPRKSVRQMVQNYENNIIQPPKQLANKPIAAPRKKKDYSIDGYHYSSSKTIHG